MPEQKCLFCNIASGTTDTVIELETDDFIIFKDIRPASKHHYLIVPKQHYESLKVLDKSHSNMVCLMQAQVKHFMEGKGICTKDALFGFHLPPFTTIKHLHMHAIAPASEMGFLSRLIFRPSSFWFQTADDAELALARMPA